MVKLKSIFILIIINLTKIEFNFYCLKN